LAAKTAEADSGGEPKEEESGDAEEQACWLWLPNKVAGGARFNELLLLLLYAEGGERSALEPRGESPEKLLVAALPAARLDVKAAGDPLPDTGLERWRFADANADAEEEDEGPPPLPLPPAPAEPRLEGCKEKPRTSCGGRDERDCSCCESAAAMSERAEASVEAASSSGSSHTSTLILRFKPRLGVDCCGCCCCCCWCWPGSTIGTDVNASPKATASLLLLISLIGCCRCCSSPDVAA